MFWRMQRLTSTRAALATVALAFALTALLPARAEAQVKVTVHVIIASKKPGPVDERLKPLKKQLEAFAFESYALDRVHELALTMGKKGVVPLPGDRTLLVTPMSRDDDGKLRVQLKIEKLVDATYAIGDGGTLIVGGPKHGDGNLILAVTQSASEK